MILNNTFGNPEQFKVLEYFTDKFNQNIEGSKKYIIFLSRFNTKFSHIEKALGNSDMNQKKLLLEYSFYKKKEYLDNLRNMAGDKNIIDRLQNYVNAKFKTLY